MSINEHNLASPGNDTFANHPVDDEQEEGEEEQEVTPVKSKGKERARFSLFPTREAQPPQYSEQGEGQEEEGQGEEEEEVRGEDETIHPSSSHRGRGDGDTDTDKDEKLRESLYELQQMNDVFEGFLGALEAARGHNEVC
jgi:hypothetical protein